jgi:hypothetical protein
MSEFNQPTNPPAFPLHNHGVQTLGMHISGMTLRDYFAAKAMQGYCSDPDYKIDCGQEDTAIAAYRMADEMLKAREA